MLDKELCAAFGIDEFSQWIMKHLDYTEDQLHELQLSTPRYIELKSRYETLKEVRDTYCGINLKAVETKETHDPNLYHFEMIIFDLQDDPSRFCKLTHHFDWICPLDKYPDVTVSGVDVDICICPNGYKVTVTGLISGEHIDKVMSSVDLTDWGNASLLEVYLTNVKKNN